MISWTKKKRLSAVSQNPVANVCVVKVKTNGTNFPWFILCHIDEDFLNHAFTLSARQTFAHRRKGYYNYYAGVDDFLVFLSHISIELNVGCGLFCVGFVNRCIV